MPDSNDLSGQITITPPLTGSELRGLLAYKDLRVCVTETTEPAGDDDIVRRTANAIVPKGGERDGRYIREELQNLVDRFGSTHRFAGFIQCLFPAGAYDEIGERFVVRGDQVDRITPRIEWPDGEIEDDEPVHTWFSLSYSSYQVLPRVLMQSMPVEWQQRMVGLLEQMRDAFDHVEQPDCYDVRPATEEVVGMLSEAQMLRVGVTADHDEENGSAVYHDADGNELEWQSRVLIPAPDPLPPYNRGRTRVALRAEGS